MVMGRDSHPRCPGFKSHHRIMDVHFFTNVVKIVMFFVKTKSTQKRPGLAHFLNERKISPNLAMRYCASSLLTILLNNHAGNVVLIVATQILSSKILI